MCEDNGKHILVYKISNKSLGELSITKSEKYHENPADRGDIVERRVDKLERWVEEHRFVIVGTSPERLGDKFRSLIINKPLSRSSLVSVQLTFYFELIFNFVLQLGTY